MKCIIKDKSTKQLRTHNDLLKKLGQPTPTTGL